MNPPAPIRLIALDLDGTLLNREKRVTPRSRSALAAAAEKGVAVVPCSGRALDSIPAEVLELPFVRYVVAAAGGAVFDLKEKRELMHFPLNTEKAVAILRGTRAAGEFGECYTGRRPYTQEDDIERIRQLIRSKDFAYLARYGVPDLCEWVRQNAGEAVKLNLMFRDLELRSSYLTRLSADPELLVTSAAAFNLEINAAGHGKGETLCALGADLGIQPAEIMACGDQINDLSMLRAVGFPVAMANAVETVRRAAAWQTATNDEDGVALAVEKFVLNT